MPEHRHGLPPLGPKAGSPKHDGDGGLRSRSRRPPTTAARATRVGAHPSSSLPGGITGALSVPVSPPPQGRPPFGNPSQRGAHSGCTRPATCAEQDGYALAHVASNAGLANHQWLPTGGPPARPGTLQAPPVATKIGSVAPRSSIFTNFRPNPSPGSHFRGRFPFFFLSGLLKVDVKKNTFFFVCVAF